MNIRPGVISPAVDRSAWTTAAHVGPLRASPLLEKYSVIALAISSRHSAPKTAGAHGVPKNKAYSSAEDTTNDLIQTCLRSLPGFICTSSSPCLLCTRRMMSW
ncbi:hypothetical protein JMJ35_007421 [Cladonia borealis]|uniref:Uncharacterized protein n=1 Tax=Cladonia borealis TaxID=184061 RepID=A0AA39UZR4_9LECA|nr:hypothetical protein JMJ35_007421 [Cladonia borealis]